MATVVNYRLWSAPAGRSWDFLAVEGGGPEWQLYAKDRTSLS